MSRVVHCEIQAVILGGQWHSRHECACLHHRVDDYDESERRIPAAGGITALPKMALPGMAWQDYCIDTEGSTLGIHQPDESAA